MHEIFGNPNVKKETQHFLQTLEKGNQSKFIIANELCLMQSEEYSGSFHDLPNGIWTFLGCKKSNNDNHLCKPNSNTTKVSHLCLTSIIMSNGTFQLIRRSFPSIFYSNECKLINTNEKIILYCGPSRNLYLIDPRTLEIELEQKIPSSLQISIPVYDRITNSIYFIGTFDRYAAKLIKWNMQNPNSNFIIYDLITNGKQFAPASSFEPHLQISQSHLVLVVISKSSVDFFIFHKRGSFFLNICHHINIILLLKEQIY